MFEDAFITIECPECGCPIGVQLRRVIAGAGTFCPACQIYITFKDERAGSRTAGRALESAFADLSKTITIEIKL
jgi:uncharacterized paraquat-inducible protein A